MLSQVLKLTPLSRFDLVENPLWTATSANQSFDWNEILDQNPWTTVLVPLGNLKPLDFAVLCDVPERRRERIIFQTYLSGIKLPEHFWEVVSNGHRIQIWLDQPISLFHKNQFADIFSKTQQVDLVFLPTVRYSVAHFFENLKGVQIPQLLIHYRQKESQFDAWAAPSEFWEMAIWIKENLVVKNFGTQVFEHHLYRIGSQNLKLFVMSPNSENYRNFLKKDRPGEHLLQISVDGVSTLTGQTMLDNFRLLLSAMASPSLKNWNLFFSRTVASLKLWKFRVWGIRIIGFLQQVLIYPEKFFYLLVHLKNVLKLKVMQIWYKRFAVKTWLVEYLWLRGCYPLRKLGWMISYQFEKRILKNKETKQP